MEIGKTIFNITMNYIEKKVLNEKEIKENDLQKIYKNVNHIFKK